MDATGDWRTIFPDWGDSGKRAEVDMGDGRILVGELAATDVGFDGEDEYPYWSLLIDGEYVDIAAMERWRPLNAP